MAVHTSGGSRWGTLQPLPPPPSFWVKKKKKERKNRGRRKKNPPSPLNSRSRSTLTILEKTCQLALRGVEKLLRWPLKGSSAESLVRKPSSNLVVGLYPRWTSIYLTLWTAPVLHPLNANSCVLNEIPFNSLRFLFSLSFRHWSSWSISLSEGHSSSYIPHGKATTMFSLSCANLFPLPSALEAVRSLDLPSVLTKAFRPLFILVSEISFTLLDNFTTQISLLLLVQMLHQYILAIFFWSALDISKASYVHKKL